MMGIWDNRFRDSFDMMRSFSPLGMVLMVLFGMLLLGLVVVGIVLLVKMASRHSPTSSSSGMMPPTSGTSYRVNADSARAMEILNERLAKGEIGEEEYERIKAKLKT